MNQRYRRAGRLKDWWGRFKRRCRIIFRAHRDKKRGINTRDKLLKSLLGAVPEFAPAKNINDAETLKIIKRHPDAIEKAEALQDRLAVELTKFVHPYYLRLGIGMAFLAELFGAMFLMSSFGFEAFSRFIMAAMFGLTLFVLAWLAVKVGTSEEKGTK